MQTLFQKLYTENSQSLVRCFLTMVEKRSKTILTLCLFPGQFAELAYSSVPIDFLIQNFSKLSQPGYPLEHYDALCGVLLVDSFRGTSANLPGYVAYRPSTGQLVVAISGTSSPKQALQDLRVLKSPHPSGRGFVHTGFWTLYQGIKAQALNAIRQGIELHSPVELVLTGHSMGGSLAYLLCIDLLSEGDKTSSPSSIRIELAVYGAPRTGDENLAIYFRELTQGRTFKEHSVKAFNDGKRFLTLHSYVHISSG